MAKFNSGFQRSYHEVGDRITFLVFLAIFGVTILYLGGEFAAANIHLPINLNQFYLNLLLIVKLAGIISLIYIIIKMPYWGTLYLLGWLVGFLLLWQLGLVNFLEVLGYILPSILILTIKLLHKKTNIKECVEGYPAG